MQCESLHGHRAASLIGPSLIEDLFPCRKVCLLVHQYGITDSSPGSEPVNRSIFIFKVARRHKIARIEDQHCRLEKEKAFSVYFKQSAAHWFSPFVQIVCMKKRNPGISPDGKPWFFYFANRKFISLIFRCFARRRFAIRKKRCYA